MTALTTGPRHANSERPGWTRFIPSWRRRADEVRGDQLVTAAVGLASAVIGVTVAAFGRDTTLAVCVGLVTLCVTPGCAFVCWHLTRDRLARALAVLAASLTWTILIASLFAWLQITALGALLAATAGVGGMGSSLFLLGQMPRQTDDSPGPIPRDDRDGAPVRTQRRYLPGSEVRPCPPSIPGSRGSAAHCAGGRGWAVRHFGDPSSRAHSGQLWFAAASRYFVPGRDGTHGRSAGARAAVHPHRMAGGCRSALPAAGRVQWDTDDARPNSTGELDLQALRRRRLSGPRRRPE